MGDIAGHEEGGQVAQEEEVHEVHAEGELGETRHPAWRLALRDAAEEQEGSEGGQQHVRCAELPRPLQHRSLDHLAGDAGVPERPPREGGSGHEAEGTDAQTAAAAPCQMAADVVGQQNQDKISISVR